jgi:hypothetical protein
MDGDTYQGSDQQILMTRQLKILEKESALMKIYNQYFLGLVLLGALAGCGGGGGGASIKNQVALSGSVVKGPVANATVVAWGLSASGTKTAPALSQTTTLQNGTFDLPKFSLYSSSVLIETTGGTYTDETTGNQLANPGLKALIPRASGTMSIAVTPLTHLAFACISSSGLTRPNIDRANALISTAFGPNIATTTPIDVTNSLAVSAANTLQVQYGMMLAAVSKIGFAKFITAVSADLNIKNTTQQFSQTTADLIINALNTLMSDGTLNTNNATLTAAKTALIATITKNTQTPIPPDPNLVNSKAFSADLRNTVLAFYNYSGGQLSTNRLSTTLGSPYNALANEIENTIQPEIAAIINSVGWVMNTKLAVGTTTTGSDGSSVTITDNGTTRTSVVKDSSGKTIAMLTFTGDSLTTPTTGMLSGTIVTAKGTATLTAQATATRDAAQGLVGATLYGSFAMNDASGNATMTCTVGSQAKPVSATFVSTTTATQLLTVAFNGRVTTATTDITVDSLAIPTIVRNANLNVVLPVQATLTGTIKALNSTGFTLAGTLIGELTNAKDLTATSFTKPTASDFVQWDASFSGSVVAAGAGLDVSATTITAKSSVFQQIDMAMQLQRTRPDGTKFNFNVTGTYSAEHNTISLVITNQAGFTLTVKTDKTGSFSGGMTGNGTTLATIDMILNIPCIKYSDNYVESLF